MRRSLRSWLWRVPLDQEVGEELDLHVELRTRELVARGIDPRAARQMALTRLGDLRRLERTCVGLGRKRDREMRPDVVVLSEGFWRSRFGGDPALVGGEIRLSGRTVTVIGIVPANFQLDIPGTNAVGPSSLWTLLNEPRDRSPVQRYAHYLQVIGRRGPAVTLEAARADMTSIADALGRESPATNDGHGVAIEPLREGLVGPELRLTTMLLLGVVGFVLLMCCANVANLLLARAAARARELAVRSALGAGRRRIVQQLLTESVVLAGLGGLVGAGVGAAILKAAPSLVPPGLLPVAVTLGFDGRVLAFCAVAAFVVAILFGLAPAWQATGMSLTQASRRTAVRPRGAQDSERCSPREKSRLPCSCSAGRGCCCARWSRSGLSIRAIALATC